MKSILKILSAVILVVGSFGGGVAYESARDKAATEEVYVARIQHICEREGVIFILHQADFNMYFRCMYAGDDKPQPLAEE